MPVLDFFPRAHLFEYMRPYVCVCIPGSPGESGLVSRGSQGIYDQEGRGGSEEAVPGPSVFPSGEPGVSGQAG